MSDPTRPPGGPAAAPAPSAAPPQARPDPRKLEQRRKFLRAAAVGAGVVCAGLAGFAPVLLRKQQRLRPPGALAEHDFLASCIKCGQCVQVCPVEALHPADITDGFGVGAPYLDPRSQACDFACDVGQCILACPTGALTYHRPAFLPTRPGEELVSQPVLAAAQHDAEGLQVRERMGLARLARPDACLSVLGKGVQGPTREGRFHGLKRYTDVDRWKPVHVSEYPYRLDRCDLCVRECPVLGAISIAETKDPEGRPRFEPAVHEPCIGCGTCEMMCPADPPAIVVDARETWRGDA